MATIVLNEDFEELLSGLGGAQLFNTRLQFAREIENFSFREDLLVGDPVLSGTQLSAQFESRDTSDTTLYTVTISGTGFNPSNTLDALEAALRDGTADGTFNRVTVDYGNQTIAQLDLTPGGFTLSSGAQQLELTGGFPISLQEIFTIVDILDPERDVDGTLADYGFTGLSLRDGGDTLASLSTDGDLVLDLGGFTLTLEDADIVVEDLFAFISPPRAQIIPTLALFDENGQQVFDGVTPLSPPWADLNSNAMLFNVPNGGGTFYVQVGAAPDQIVSWQAQNGLYGLFSSFWGFSENANRQTFEDRGDAPANATTPYRLNSGADFRGAVDFVGDLDWIRVELPDPEMTLFSAWDYSTTVQGAVRFEVFGLGQPDPVLRDLDGISFSRLTITTPDGTEVISATDVESFAAFIDALDVELARFAPSLPNIGGLGLAFATGDPHLLTHDGLGYSFHAAGEFVLMRATNDMPFELQARMEPAGPSVTVNTAAVLQAGDDVIMIAASGPALQINGAEVTLADGGRLDPQDFLTIAREGNSYRIFIQDPSGATSLVQVDIIGNRVDIGVGLTDFWRGNVEGLLGNFSGTIQDDLRVAGTGDAVSFPLQYGDTGGNIGLYGVFRDSWRVTDDNTLFSYAPGVGPDSFFLPEYPGVMVSLDDFTGPELADAIAAATAAGLVPGTLAFNNAVLDLVVTGDESFLESAVAVQGALDNAGATSEDVFVSEVVAGDGILDQFLPVSGRVMDANGAELTDTTVTFTPAGRVVNLTRETGTGNSFEFRLAEGSTGRLDASRDWDVSAGDPAVTVLDALNVLRLAVGLDPSFGAATAQNFVAADINGDGAVTALDALEVLRAAVGLTSPAAPRWVFFDAETDWDSVAASRLNVNAPETGIDLTVAGPSDSLALQGMLLGHMTSYTGMEPI